MSEVRFISQETQEEKQARIVAQFEQLLESYAVWLGAPRKCGGMRRVEAALLTLVEEVAEQQTRPNDHVLVALAGVKGHLDIAELLLESCACSDPDSSRRKLEKLDWTKKDAIETSVAWLIANSPEAFCAKELFHHLLERCLPPKSEVTSA